MAPVENKDATSIPWENFSNWVHAICVVTFDLELGQALEMIYPANRELTESERSNICYLSFPDSNSGVMGNVQFSFRIRSSACSPALLPPALLHYTATCPPPEQLDEGYMYGYVYFRQVKDKSLKRGYFQKSVVLLSVLPLVGLFTRVLEVLAPEYFDCGPASIEAACHNIDQWPPPRPGEYLALPLLGQVLHTRLPSTADKPALLVAPPSPSLNVPTPHQVQVFEVLSGLVCQLQLLWELVLTAEPLVVMAAAPTTAANTVHALRSLIAPLKYSGDFRPFFTIHDSEFKEYTTRTTAPPNVMLGVTNPFFAKTLRHWPHVVHPLEDGGVGSSPSRTRVPRKARSLDHKPGVYTKFKPYLQPDKSLSKVVLRGVQTGRPLEVQSALLRRHLLELTQSFMIPLERYVASLMPLHRNISPYKGAPSLRPFNPDEFLATLETAGPQLTSGIRGDWEGLYRRFFRCVNFSVWFNARYREISEKLTALHLQALSEADLESWMSSHGEVEKVDLILRVRHKLTAARSLSAVSQSTIAKLERQLETLLASIPDDLRRVLVSSHSDHRCSECHAHYSDPAGDCPSPQHLHTSPHHNDSHPIDGGSNVASRPSDCSSAVLSRQSDCNTVLSKPSDCSTVLSRASDSSTVLSRASECSPVLSKTIDCSPVLPKQSDCNTVLSKPSDCSSVLSRSSDCPAILESSLQRPEIDRRPLTNKEESFLCDSMLNCSVDVAVKAEDLLLETKEGDLDSCSTPAITKAEKNSLNTEQHANDMQRSEILLPEVDETEAIKS